MKKKLRIIHLPSSIGDNSYNLSLGEKSLGYHSIFLLFNNKRGRGNTYSKNNYDQIIEFGSKIEGIIRILLFYIIAIFKYDVFHFNAGMSLFYSERFKYLNHIDLIFLKIFKKKVIMTYQGSSGRIVSHSITRSISYFTEDDLIESKRTDNIKKYRFKVVNRFADLVYATNPDLLNSLPPKSKFRAYTKLSPFNEKIRFKYYKNNKIVIGHAPSDLKIKGTAHFNKSVELLKSEGYDFDVKIAQGYSRESMTLFYSNIDIFVDQLLVGWYGGAAVEAMAEGAAVVAYICQEDLKFCAQDFVKAMAIINAEPASLSTILRALLDNPILLDEYKDKSFRFFHSHHNIYRIAKTITKDYESLYK